jgi:outer membrane protein assembly factor BamB
MVWSAPSGDHSYSSAQLATFDGETGLLMSTNTGLQFLDVRDGHTLWEHPWPGDNYRALQPLVAGNSILFTTSLGLGTRKITVHKMDSKWEITEDWTSRDLKPDFNDFVEYQGYLYGFDGNIFTCVSLETGKRAWKRGRYGSGQVLLLPDAGQLLVTSETGEIVLLKADPTKPIELAKVPAIEGKTWNHPVLIGSRLYIRNAEMAACYELALGSATPPEKPAGVAAAND